MTHGLTDRSWESMKRTTTLSEWWQSINGETLPQGPRATEQSSTSQGGSATFRYLEREPTPTARYVHRFSNIYLLVLYTRTHTLPPWVLHALHLEVTSIVGRGPRWVCPITEH